MRRALIALAVLFSLAACTKSPAVIPPLEASQGIAQADAVTAAGPHNEFDVMFLQMMIAHQQQGLQMLKLGQQKAVREEVVDLAGAIDVVEAEEVRSMQRWLQAWNVPAAEITDPALHAAHGGRPATGPEEIQALQDATGADFETKFLNLLIAHQHNAVELAQQLATTGQNGTVQQFAERVRLSRTQQIKQMLTLAAG
ncbi:DUF305 domain-containing protein [Dactylosporangium vinaceum]|uniref:DUF305 domain-containing protein n=1 Tax=Dactylosporangium vinaceum TaxID=53362 RepID=A0ABV5MFY8_9ACTN|nr:DUF305 domain-containing protein [Dactylosporangium vinaceum]UAB98906.1 DUF305 domain-containing protein [Dactylosporangium vinaceum]